MKKLKLTCKRCQSPITDMWITEPYPPECGPAAPMHYVCRRVVMQAHEEETNAVQKRVDKVGFRMLALLERTALLLTMPYELGADASQLQHDILLLINEVKGARS